MQVGTDTAAVEVDYQAAAQLRAALRRLTHTTDEVTRKHRLTPRRYELLLFIQAADDAGRPATVGSLTEPLQTSQGSVTQLVDAAARAGLLTRTASPTDKRSSHLRLTTTGRQRLRGTHKELGPERERVAAVINENF